MSETGAPKLDSRLPDGNRNGLDSAASELVERPDELRVAIVLLDCRRTVHDHAAGEVIPVVRLRRIEVIRRADDLAASERLMRRALEDRSGQSVLPLDVEDELSAAFRQIEVELAAGQQQDGEGDDGDGSGGAIGGEQ